METAQEREVQLLQGRQAWPLHMMGMGTAAAGGCFDGGYGGYGGGGAGDCFVLGWEQPPPAPFGCFGLLAADVHDLFPLFAGMESPLPVMSSSTLTTAPPPPPAHDAVAAIPGELDDLLLNFWDASCHDGDVGGQRKAPVQQQDAFNSTTTTTCVTHEHEQTTTTTATDAAAAATTTNSFLHCDYDDGDDPLSSIFCTTGPTALPAEEAVAFQAPAYAAAEPLLSSSSSNCGGGLLAGASATPVASRARTPPLPRSSSSSTPSRKRATREESSSDPAAAECSQAESESSKRRKSSGSAASFAGVLCPFALLKPDGLDGGATLADINARILMRPTRPVRHPVGEFACAPRVSADQPGISGKAVSSFTRLHTPGRGTITIIRTRG